MTTATATLPGMNEGSTSSGSDTMKQMFRNCYEEARDGLDRAQAAYQHSVERMHDIRTQMDLYEALEDAEINFQSNLPFDVHYATPDGAQVVRIYTESRDKAVELFWCYVAGHDAENNRLVYVEGVAA